MMKSTALFHVFVLSALMVCLFGGASALAQPDIIIDGGFIECVEDTAGTTPNGVIDEGTDSVRVTVFAAIPNGNTGPYNLCFEDSVEAGLWPVPGLGDFDASVPQISYLCNPVTLYRMETQVTANMGLDSLYDADSCLIVATLTFHPQNLIASAGDAALFSVTVKSNDDLDNGPWCRSDPLTVVLPCSINTVTGCGTILWDEYGGFRNDNIVAIDDSVWWVFAADTADMDTFYIDFSCISSDLGSDKVHSGFTGKYRVHALDLLENSLTDTFFVTYCEWDTFYGDLSTTCWDTCYVLRWIDNNPPSTCLACYDSCHIVNGNYIPNDTMGWWPNYGSPWWPYLGVGDTLRIFWSIGYADTCNYPPLSSCRGDTVALCNTLERLRNFDAAWIGVDFSGFVDSCGADPTWWPVNSIPGGTSPYMGPGDSLIAPHKIWIGGPGGYGGIEGDSLLWVDIPIDIVNWPLIQCCIDPTLETGNAPDLYFIDDAGNDYGPEDYQCEFCIDNVCPDGPLADLRQDTLCRRFSPYDSTENRWWSISPDSIRVWLDSLDAAGNPDSLENLFLVGIDVRSEPDEITGDIVAVLDWFNPLLAPQYIPFERDTWLFPEGPYDSAAFDWYGKQGTDSLDPWLDLTNICPLGFNVGLTYARFMDRAGNNCIWGWDNDSTTVLPNYTQRNRIHAVVDTCIPDVVVLSDTLTVMNIVLGSGAPVPIGPETGYPTYQWTTGDEDPILRFRPERFFDQGLHDSCLVERLFAHVLVERVVEFGCGTWPNPDDTAGFYSHEDSTDGSATWLWSPIDFYANDVNGPIIQFHWGHEFPGGGYLNDGLYRLELQILDDAGMIYTDPCYVWLNGTGPCFDTVRVAGPDTACALHFFTDDTMCVYIVTDTTAEFVEVDWSCIPNLNTDCTFVHTVSYDSTHIAGGLAEWMVCIEGILADYIDTVDTDNNHYELDSLAQKGVCDTNDCGLQTIGVYAWDSDSVMSRYYQVDCHQIPDGCQEAILGLTPCPRIVSGHPEFFFYNPDTMAADSAANLGFPWGPEPDWNAISPGNLDHAYSASLNWAQDNVQDTVFMRVLIDSLTINALGGDTIEISIRNDNETPTRERVIRRPLYHQPDTLANNSIYHGRLTRYYNPADGLLTPYFQFIYMWNGTWFISGGMDSIEMVDFNKQDTVLVTVTVIDSNDALECDSVFADLDVDNINPEFYDWTGIAAGTRDPNTGSTPSVWNLGVDNDCGFRFGEGDTFKLKVKLSESVHFDSAAYPNTDGSWRDPGTGEWKLTRNWQISAIDNMTEDLLIVAGDTIKVWLDEVIEDSVAYDSSYYTLIGRFTNIPDDYCNTNVNLLIRSAWDQAGNPGRYNNPVYTDAYEADACEDTSFAIYIVNIDPFIIGCPLVWNLTDSIPGWIAPEDLDVEVIASIIETPEVWACTLGTIPDSIQHIRGNFQQITDDPNPWLNADSVGAWYLWADTSVCDSLEFWARDYYWWLVADSSDLATIHCDGDTLDFWIRFNTFGGASDTGFFDECVQVDVNEPVWVNAWAEDTAGTMEITDTTCADPHAPIILWANFTDDMIDCPTGNGLGVVDTLIWADISGITGDTTDTKVAPDSIWPDLGVPPYGYAFWTVIPDTAFWCHAETLVTWDALALTDSIGHYDRELFFRDTLCFHSDCMPPVFDYAVAGCDTDTVTVPTPTCVNMPIYGYLSPGNPIYLLACFNDPDTDSSLGIDSLWVDLSELDMTTSGWIAAEDTCWADSFYTVCGYWGYTTSYVLNQPFDNLDTAWVWFKAMDNFGNVDSFHVAIGVIDTLPPIVDFIYTIGDDSVRAYVTPADEHVTVYADLIPGDTYMASGPKDVWADFSRFMCDSAQRAGYDTLYADLVYETSPGNWRAFWGYDSLYYVSLGYNSITPFFLHVCDSLHMPANLSPPDGPDPIGLDVGAEGLYDTLWVHVTDSACNVGTHYNIFEISGGDSTVPDVDSVWVMTNRCDTTLGFISSQPLDSLHIEVWAWMDTMFNGYEDTLRIDSLQADLAGLNPTLYGWTDWGMPGHYGGWPVYGDANDPNHGQAFWDLVMDGQGRTRLVAKWVNLTAEGLGCGDSVVVPVKGIRQTGGGGSHGYYLDVEYGQAWVDTTRPYIYDMRVYNSTVSPDDTTWVSPNFPVYVDICAVDTICWPGYGNEPGFDLAMGDPPDGPYISFCAGAENALRDLWTWDTTSFSVEYNGGDTVCLRWIGMPIYDDTCNLVDYDNLNGCVTAYIQDCLSNPAYPVTKEVTTDDRPPEYVLSAVRGDYTFETPFPGDPDSVGIDSVLVLRRGIYNLDWDSLMTVYVVVDNWPGDTLISFTQTWIDFRHPTNHPALNFMIDGPDTVANPDVVFYNTDGMHRDSIVWYVPLYGSELFDVTIPSDKYYFALQLSDTFGNSIGDTNSMGEWTTLFCDSSDEGLDSAIVFTIQNYNVPNPGMVLLADSMNKWNNEKLSPDTAENLYKIWHPMGAKSEEELEWRWYTNSTRFFIFVEDPVLQHDLIDNDADGLVDELGEGVDFYTADVRINNYPQVAHVDSMNSGGVWINYLWFEDNFSEGQYNVELFISDIYGHRDTLGLAMYSPDTLALQFFEDESCPMGVQMVFADTNMVDVPINYNGMDVTALDLSLYQLPDSLFVYKNFAWLDIELTDSTIFNSIPPVPGSGVDTDTSTTPDSTNWNNGLATSIVLYDPTMTPVPHFVQRYYLDLANFPHATLVDTTGTALESLPDGIYTIVLDPLDRVGNSCVYTWQFILDRTCPSIDSLYVTQSGFGIAEDTLYASWDYVEIKAHVNDLLDGVDSVVFDYCFDANRDGVLDAYPFWIQANILSVPNSATDSTYMWACYWSVMNLPWSSEDTLGMPPVDTLGRCINRYFVRIQAWDHFSNTCEYYIPVDIIDDIAPLAYIVYPPQGAVFNSQIDSEMVVTAYDSVGGTYDPMPGDTFTFNPLGRWFDLAKGMFQYKYYEAPGTYVSGNDDPAAGWVTIRTGLPDSLGGDTSTYRAPDDSFHVRLNIADWPSHQYNMRFWTFDVCGNNDPLNTPVVTFWVQEDTINPIASITWPDPDMWVTDLHCSTGFVPIRATVPFYFDIDSVEFWYVDSLTIPGIGQHIHIGSVTQADSVNWNWAHYFSTDLWDTRHLLSGFYWLYAIAWDSSGNFDANPHWSRVMLDNTPGEITDCWISDPDSDATNKYFEIDATREDTMFVLRATAKDSIVDMWGVTHYGDIRWVQFQVLTRFGVWEDLDTNFTDPMGYNPLYGADIYVGNANGVYNGISCDNVPDTAGIYECYVMFSDFGNSPLDSIRFRAYCADGTDRTWPDPPESDKYWGHPNWEGDRNRDCGLDRDAVLCSNSLMIYDQLPEGVYLWARNHSDFDDDLPVFGGGISPLARFGCNDPYALDTVLFVAKYDTLPGDEWLLHFVYWRSGAWDADTTVTVPGDTMYIPNDISLNPSAPALGPIGLINAWDSLYVIWTDIRQWIANDAALHGYTNVDLTFAAYVTDWTGNTSPLMDDTSKFTIRWDCQAPICEITDPDAGDPLWATNDDCDTYTALQAYMDSSLEANRELWEWGWTVGDLWETHWYWSYVGGPLNDTGMVDSDLFDAGCWPDPYGWHRDSTDQWGCCYYDRFNVEWNNTLFRTVEGYKAGTGQIWMVVTDDVGNVDTCMVEVEVDNEAPYAPITHVSYVQNDPGDPGNRVRVTHEVTWLRDSDPDTIEILYNRGTDPGGDDPEAFVIFYCDADKVLNCTGDPIDIHNVQLWELCQDTSRNHVCPGDTLPSDSVLFDTFKEAQEFDQYPPDDDANDRYEIALLLDNTYTPGTYHFSFIATDDYGNIEGDANMNDTLTIACGGRPADPDITKIDLFVRVVNVNEPQVVIRQPDYGHTCVHEQILLSAEDATDPTYFTGEIDTVFFWTQTDGGDSLLGFDTDTTGAVYTFELYEEEVPGMAGWYVANSYQWFAERDLFPDVWVRVLNPNGSIYNTFDMEYSGGRWSYNAYLSYNPAGFQYFFIIDANDNNEADPNPYDRHVNDPRYTCTGADTAVVQVWDWSLDFDTRVLTNRSYNFWTEVVWHDTVGYHVIENPSEGDSTHVFFVDNEPAEGTSDIEFDVTRVAAGMQAPGEGGVCNPADIVWFVTDIQAIDGFYNLPVEDICKVVYQRSYTNYDNYLAEDSTGWENVDTVYSNQDSGWTEAWPGSWVAVNPLIDNLDNDGDGLVDETADVQAGDGVGEENVRIWVRAVIVDQCGNTFYTEPDSLWLDVSEAQACITEIEGVSPADNQTIIIPEDHNIEVIATDHSAPFDQAILGRFQYRTLPPDTNGWMDMQPMMGSGETSVVRHVHGVFTFIWDLDSLHALPGSPDPENWYQGRVVAEDTVNNNDSCDNVICQITFRLNDITPAARVEMYIVYSDTDTASTCTVDSVYYINPDPPYYLRGVFAPTSIDTGLASLTFQYRTRDCADMIYTVSEWRNIETIWEPIENDTANVTDSVTFQPRPEDVGDQGFDLRVIVEDYNGNDTSDVWTLWVDETPITQAEDDIPTVYYEILHEGVVIINEDALLTVVYEPDPVSCEVNVAEAWLEVTEVDTVSPTTYDLGYFVWDTLGTWVFDFGGNICSTFAAAGGSGQYYFDIYTVDCAGNTGDRRVLIDAGGDLGVFDVLTVDCIEPVCGDLYRTDDCENLVANGGETVHLSWEIFERTLSFDGEHTFTDLELVYLIADYNGGDEIASDSLMPDSVVGDSVAYFTWNTQTVTDDSTAVVLWLHAFDTAENNEQVCDTVFILREGSPPEHAAIDSITYWAWDCVAETLALFTDRIFDGTTEVGCDDSVIVYGSLPEYQQYIEYVELWVQRQGGDSTLEDDQDWNPSWTSNGADYHLDWVPDTSGYYRVWVIAYDDACTQQEGTTIDEFWAYVDCDDPYGWIAAANGVPTQGPSVVDTFEVEMWSGDHDPTYFWVEWADNLDPNDSTQVGNQVALWAKPHHWPNDSDTYDQVWTRVDSIPSPCNAHFIIWIDSIYHCGDTLDLVIVAEDRWGNTTEFDLDDPWYAYEVFNTGRYDVGIIHDTEPPVTHIWGVGTENDPSTDVVINQQTHEVTIVGGDTVDVYLHAFSQVGDGSLERVVFEMSFDGITWDELGTDYEGEDPSQYCEGMDPPQPWWCDTEHPILWSMLWDISGIDGDVYIRTWGEDLCANIETDPVVYTVHIDATPPMAKVFVWYEGVNVDTVYCEDWDEEQIPDSAERFSIFTLGGCPDPLTPWDVYGAEWYMKRATDYPLGDSSWCVIGDDSTAPFSMRDVNFWDGSIGPCPYPQPGVWYDIAILANDRLGNIMTWDRFLNYGEGMTYEEKWADLIARGFVKRFKVVDYTAPVAYDLVLWPDQTPDSSVIFLTASCSLQVTVADPDVEAVTFGTREYGQTGPFTEIERVEGDSLLPPFAPVEGYWNTELLNGTYVVGAFAEDDLGNMDGDPAGGVPPQHTRTVNIDNEKPEALVDHVEQEGVTVTTLERGTEAIFYIEANDNFGLRNVSLYYRESGGNPDNWTLIPDTVTAWPYTIHWVVPTTAVVGWTYDFAAIATDLVNLTDEMDHQGNYIVDWSAEITDTDAYITLFTIGGQDAATVPHVHGTDVELVAHFEPNLDYVRFVWIRGGDTTTICTVPVTIGDTVATNDACPWDVTALVEGPGEVGAIGSADLGGELVTIGYDYRDVEIDHSLVLSLGDHTPVSHDVLGGACGAEAAALNASVGLVLDYSGSMSGAIDDLEDAAHLFVDNMQAGDRGAIIKFASTTQVMQDFTDDLDALHTAIDAVPSVGSSTYLFDAICSTAVLITPETNRRVIVAMTDGESSGSVDAAITCANDANATVYTVGLGAANGAILQQIADETGGQYYHAPEASDLADIYEQIAGEILTGGALIPDDLIVEFLTPPSDNMIDTVWFEWKRTADPDLDPLYTPIGRAIWDEATGKWAYQWEAFNEDCNLISIRAVTWDRSVPTPNRSYIIFADSVHMDNCDPIVNITNINGDLTPANMEIPKGEVVNIAVTAYDVFADGGNSWVKGDSGIVSVCIYYRAEGDISWLYLGCPTSPTWDVVWNTGGLSFGAYELQAVATDWAGNCATTTITINITDALYQRAFIVGYDRDDDYACPDTLWAITDDCDENTTDYVRFQYSTDEGETWVALGEDQTGEDFCLECFQYHIWSVQLEFDVIPEGAIFRAIATDESGNDDPEPAVFAFADVTDSPEPVVWAYDWVQVPVMEGQVPWVFSVLEDHSEVCFTDHELVCVNPVEGDPMHYAGLLDPNRTSPCRIYNTDGMLTVFSSVYDEETGHMMISRYFMDIHQTDNLGGSNGWLTSETGQTQIYVPSHGLWEDGTIYFEPYLDAQTVNLIPVEQPYYTLASDVENIYFGGDLEGADLVPSSFKLRFYGIPEGAAPDQIVPVWWNEVGGVWSELGIQYAEVDTVNWTVTFQSRIDQVTYAPEGEECFFVTFAVMVREVGFTIDGPYFVDAYEGYWDYPDSCYYTPERGPTIGDDPAYWVVLCDGDGVPPEEWIDVWLDDIRIIHNGVAVEFVGYPDIFLDDYDDVSGIYKVYFNHAEWACIHSPWHCEMQAGPHTIRFRVYDGVGHEVEAAAPFYVDVTGPDVFTWGRYICHNTEMIATITDLEACINLESLELTIWNLLDPGGEHLHYYHDVMTITEVENGYQVNFILTFDDLDQLLLLEGNDINELAVTWYVENTLALENAENTFLYIVDLEPPVIVPVSPVGEAYDNDGDGVANEDPRDCINNDGDYWWYGGEWQERFDEDWIDYEPDTLFFGERPTIQGAMNDNPQCGSGASGVNLETFHLFIDGVDFTIADTANADLNFTVLQPGNDDAFFLFGGTDNEILDQFYEPGEHRITVIAGDSVCGNIAGYPFSWTYYIMVPGPAISFLSPEGCGDWFDPEGVNEFGFVVDGTGVPIAINGIEYSVFILPSGELISGPTVINPETPTHHEEMVTIAYPFQDDDLGIAIEVTARAQMSGDDYGVTVSSHTYAIDDLGPTIIPVIPDSGEVFNRSQAIVIEASYMDDGGVLLSANPGGDDAGMNITIPARAGRTALGKTNASSSRTDLAPLGIERPGSRGASGAILDGGGAHLDDVGSGVDSATVKVIRPDGVYIIPEVGPYYEWYDDHLKFTMLQPHIPGRYTINVIVWDCIGNYNSISWPFFVSSDEPAVEFVARSGECEYDGFWNPDQQLTVEATIEEVHGVNITRDGIHLNIYRIYNSDSGSVEELLVPYAAYSLSPQPNDGDVAQVFTLMATPSLNPEPADIAVRFELIVADIYGTEATMNKTYQIDRMAPWIDILSPAEVVPEGELVTIHAVFSDDPPPAIATAPGGDRGRFASPSSILSGTPQQNGRITRATRTRSTATGGFGDWSTVMTGGLDDFDGNAGVDANCVQLLLRHPDGTIADLTSASTVDATSITWSGNLDRGDYVITVKVCDYVCNEGVAIWNFRVANGACPTIAFVEPYYVSSMPHTFLIDVVDSTGVDVGSLRLLVEKLQRIHTDSTDIEHYVVITDNASIAWDGQTDSLLVTYVANFFLENSMTVKDVGVRLTLCASDLDENLCCVSKNYTVDQDNPFIDIDGVVPSLDNPLVIDSRPTFIVSFHEEGGGTGLDADAVSITLATLGGVIQAGATEVNVAPSGASGNVSFQPDEGLEPGKYLLRASVADMGGNVAMAEWVYRVGKEIPVLTGKKSYVWPNPFVPGEGGAHFELGVTGEGTAFVMVKVYDIAGQFVATVYEGQYEPGQAIIWQGVNDKGQEVANGVYLAHVVIETGGQVSDEIVKVAFKKVK